MYEAVSGRTRNTKLKHIGEWVWRAAAALARRRRLGPFRPAKDRKDRRARDLAAMARAGFDYDLAKKVIDAASPDALDEA